MTKHTPGPWYYTKTPIVGFIVRSSSSKSDTGRDKFIADCGKVHHDPFSPEFEANAALIASAPELLEALRKIAKMIEKSEPRPMHPVTGELLGRRPKAQKMIDIANAAIAKAEGRS